MEGPDLDVVYDWDGETFMVEKPDSMWCGFYWKNGSRTESSEGDEKAVMLW